VIPQIDGDINEPAWQLASWSDPFLDIEGERRAVPKYLTRVKLLWSDSCLYIAAKLEEPDVSASLKIRDMIIYHDNDFEVFLDPNNDAHQYFEIEVNAFNTILDLYMSKPYRNGGEAMLSYNLPGLQSAVKVVGVINQTVEKDSCWTIEMAIPFSSIHIGNRWESPKQGVLWRINFSRVQWEWEVKNNAYSKKTDTAGKTLPENNWVWSPQGVVNMHYPERWGYLLFAKDNQNGKTFVLPVDEKRKAYLWLVYYKQKSFFLKNGKYASSLQDLEVLTADVQVEGVSNRLHMEATTRQFCVYITDSKTTLSVNHDGLVQAVKKII
jgi:hypothetical protein